MNYVSFIAKKLYKHQDGTQGVSRSAIQIATVGVAIGLAVMIISVCVVLGFKGEIRSKVIGLGSHIQVMNYESMYSLESKPVVVNSQFMSSLSEVEGVRHVQRFCTKTGMLKTDNSFKGILLKGVGPEYDANFLSNHIIEGKLPLFSDSTSTNNIVVSKIIADELRLQVGSRVYAYFFENSIKVRRFKVAAIYSTNLTDLDNNLIFTDLYTCNKLNGWKENQCSGAEILLSDFSQLDEVAPRVINRVNRKYDQYGASYSTATITELYPQIFAWLNLLDTNVWVILILMIGVAGFTMVSGLLIIILERTNFIGIMKALGASTTSVRHIFLYFSSFVIGRGLLWGNVLGIGLVVLQDYFHVIKLDPASYYVNTVPVVLHLGYIIAINIATMLSCMMVLIVPSYLIARIRPATSIRFE